MNILHSIGAFIAAAGVAISGLFGFHAPEPVQNFGAALPAATAVFETSLAAPISSSATTLTLTENSVRGGGSVSGYTCLTIDEGSAQAETVCGTLSGTSMTGMTRGISQSTGTSTVASLQFSHRRGANVKITDFPVIQIVKAQNNGEDTFPNQLLYATGVTPTNLNALTDKEYVDGLAFSGAGVIDATSIAKGVVELATGAEAAASTATGGSGNLAIPSSIATSTYNAATATNVVVVTDGTGKIDADFIPTALGTTTTIGNTRALDIGKNQEVFTTSGTFSVPEGIGKVWVEVIGPGGPGGSDSDGSGVLSASSTFSTFVIAQGGSSANTGAAATGAGGGGAGAYCAGFVDVSATSSVAVVIGTASAATADAGGTGGTGAGGAGGTCSGTATDLFELESIDGSAAFVDAAGDAWGGKGADTPYGIGAGDSPGTARTNGRGYGSGGAGSGNDGVGSTGKDGLIIVRW